MLRASGEKTTDEVYPADNAAVPSRGQELPQNSQHREDLLLGLSPLTLEAPWDQVFSLPPSEPGLFCKHMENSAPFQKLKLLSQFPLFALL